jgi:hypothetical protein
MTKAELAKFIADSTAKAALAATAKKDSTLDEKIAAAKGAKAGKDTSLAAAQKENPFFFGAGPLVPRIYMNEQKQQYPAPGSVIGVARIKDTALVNKYLNLTSVKSFIPFKSKILLVS